MVYLAQTNIDPKWKPNESSDDMQMFFESIAILRWCWSWRRTAFIQCRVHKRSDPSQFPNEWIRPIYVSEFEPIFSPHLLHYIIVVAAVAVLW